jgi:hypothetical protein
MKSAPHGKLTSAVEVTNLSEHGFWILIQDRELFLPFEQFPWFKDASVGRILNVERQGEDHLYWPDLDVDLSVESIERPQDFPLVSRSLPKKKARQTTGRSRRQATGRRRPGSAGG